MAREQAQSAARSIGESGPLGLALLPLTAAGVLVAVDALIPALLLLGCTSAFLGVTSTRLFVRSRGRARQLAAQAADHAEMIGLLLRDVQKGGSDWVWEVDPALRILAPSPRLAEMLRTAPRMLEGSRLIERLAGDRWQAGDLDPALRDLAAQLKRRESFDRMVVPVEIDGITAWWEMSARPRYDGGGAFLGFRGVASDVTEQRQIARRAAELAHYDPLTALPNRPHLIDALGKAVAKAGPGAAGCALIILSLDGFAAVNDVMGHRTGDQLLAQAARRLRGCCSDADICGRIGGDEFALVVSRTTPHDVDRVTSRLLATVGAPYTIDGQAVHIGVSIGSACTPIGGLAAEAMLCSAQLAVTQARQAGGGVHRAFEPQWRTGAAARQTIELALRRALEAGEMDALYQPVVNVVTGAIWGFDALLHWRDPALATIDPVRLTRIAHETRLDARIEAWLMHAACRDAAAWPSAVRVAVGMSADASSSDADPVVAAMSALAEAGLDAGRLELGLGERPALSSEALQSAAFGPLGAMGVRLSLVAMTADAAPLGLLRRGRFDRVGIDEGLVRAISKGDAASVALVEAIMSIARHHGIEVTARGVSTQAQHDAALAVGCRLMQGDFFGSPMRARDAGRLLTQPALRSD